ncbi:fluoride efflux transporter FluC [Aeromicrobium choanae]|uniref:Fluoride-specific ion channel FluC n=1 Tax=Aeromicrobium choanae TaxID=1736691 RepID=A0A1T4YU26_9ACTN|nr:CrcB family protein [Aeromicrobium choanae]SKB05098.1 CrcB protein [Aeromicrobium choanae]
MRADDALARPLFLQPAVLALVMLGGAVGTAARAVLADAFPVSDGAWPWATFGVNVAGSFLLGLLVALVAVRGGRSGAWRLVRPALGAGVLGGFTTYSAFAVEVDRLLGGGSVGLGLAYAGASVVGGVLAAALGVLAGGGVPAPRSGEAGS